MSSSVGKRQRERQKLERAQDKAKRKAVRQAASADEADADAMSDRSEQQLIDELRALQQAFEDGELSAEDFDDRRVRLQAQFDRLAQTGWPVGHKAPSDANRRA